MIRRSGIFRGRLLAALVAGSLLWWPGAAALADTAEDLARVLEGADYQTELPDALEVEPAETREPIDLSGWEFLGYLILGVVVIILAIVIYRELREPLLRLWYAARGLKMPERKAPAEPELQPITAAEEGTALERADALARQGRFAEAVRILLLACIETVRDFAPGAAEDSLTSREVLRHAPLDARAQDAFGVLVAAEEAGRFAELHVGEADYGRCRSEFGIFAEASRGGS